MNVTYAIEFFVKPAERGRFLSLINGVLDSMRSEKTFVSATFHADPQDPDHFFLHETWSDHEDVVEVQLKRAYREAFHAALPDMLEGERRIAIWQPLRVL